MSAKWEEYTKAILLALGGDDLLIDDYSQAYQVLFLPTFHKPACITVSGNASSGIISISLLESGLGDIFDSIWQRKTRNTNYSVASNQYRCTSDTDILAPSEYQTITTRIDTIQPWLLPELHLSSRDGIAIRIAYISDEQSHIIHISSPDINQAPRHSAYIITLLSVAHSHFSALPFQQYFDILQLYMPDIQTKP
jgi:hypothetical protein